MDKEQIQQEICKQGEVVRQLKNEKAEKSKVGLQILQFVI